MLVGGGSFLLSSSFPLFLLNLSSFSCSGGDVAHSSHSAKAAASAIIGHRLRCSAVNGMDPVLNIFRATDELDAPGIPKKTKDDLENFCNYATEYCLSYVNEPSVGLWHIQNHIHDKILPKNHQMRSKLLETLQECREINLELDSAIDHTHIWKAGGDNEGESDSIVDTPCKKILIDTLDVCKDVNKLLRKIAKKVTEKSVVRLVKIAAGTSI